MVPKMTIIIAYNGPPRPPIAAKAMQRDNAHLNAPTAVFPWVSIPPFPVSPF